VGATAQNAADCKGAAASISQPFDSQWLGPSQLPSPRIPLLPSYRHADLEVCEPLTAEPVRLWIEYVNLQEIVRLGIRLLECLSGLAAATHGAVGVTV